MIVEQYLGEQGAEQFLEKVICYLCLQQIELVRIHGPFVSEQEIERIANSLEHKENLIIWKKLLLKKVMKSSICRRRDEDELYSQALDIIKSEGKASTSFLQRKLQIGYNRAARIIDMMEEKGIVSKANHVGKREVL